MLTYIIQSSLCWLMLYVVYALLLSKQTFYAYNRLFLLLSLVLGLSLPFLIESLLAFRLNEPILLELPEVYVGLMEVINVAELEKAAQEGAGESWSLWLGVYMIGALICTIRFLMGLGQLWTLKKAGQQNDFQSFSLIRNKEINQAFSFFNWIFWNPSWDYKEDQYKTILFHEIAHIKLKHSLDILAIELLGIIFWFNPLVQLYKRAIKNVHEYQADAEVLREYPVRPYGQMLLYQARYKDTNYLIVNHFCSSQIKKRIMMMTKTPSKKARLWMYAFALPVVLFVGTLFLQSSTLPEGEHSVLVDPNLESINDPDNMPKFAGCEAEKDQEAKKACSQQKLFKFIIDNLKYPKAAKNAGIEGMVIISFVVDAEGNIKNAKIEKDPGYDCGKVALDIVNSMPKWEPGTKDGKAVAVEMKLPFKFKLDSEEKELSKAHQLEELDHLPVFDGCEGETEDKAAAKKCSDGNMIQFIGKTMRYPKAAAEAGIEGLVVARFIVERDGSVSNVSLLKGIGGGCDEEVMRVIYSMPNWTAATKEGKAVRTELKLPVRFQLDQAKNLSNRPFDYDLKLEGYQIGPNPSDGVFNLKFKGTEAPLNINIFDMEGKMIYQENDNQFNGFYSKDIRLNNPNKGMYFIQIRQGGKAHIEQIVIQ